MSLVIKVSNDAEEIRQLVKEGFCPVECSIGESIVDDLVMDHHGEFSHLESVAIRAYRDNFGTRRDDPRFVVAGSVDADAAFCIAALAGLLPHPDAEDGLRLDLNLLARLIAKVDTDLIGINLAKEPFGSMLIMWNKMFGYGRTERAAIAGVYGWEIFTSRNATTLKPYMDAGAVAEVRRREAANKDLEDFGSFYFFDEEYKILIIDGASEWGFDVWYDRRTGVEGPADPMVWSAPVVAVLFKETDSITIGCPNMQVAEALFGPGGLKNLFPLLGEGWGGRESIGGSPRGMQMTPSHLSWIVQQAQKCRLSVLKK